jgi:excinuclease ABC subunit B
MTDSMRRALDETSRRRAKQEAYNQAHGIEPVSIFKAVRDLTDEVTSRATAESKAEYHADSPADLPEADFQRVVDELEREMRRAALDLEFEKAAALRDQIFELRDARAEREDLAPWQRARALAGQRR